MDLSGRSINLKHAAGTFGLAVLTPKHSWVAWVAQKKCKRFFTHHGGKSFNTASGNHVIKTQDTRHVTTTCSSQSSARVSKTRKVLRSASGEGLSEIDSTEPEHHRRSVVHPFPGQSIDGELIYEGLALFLCVEACVEPGKPLMAHQVKMHDVHQNDHLGIWQGARKPVERPSRLPVDS